MNATPPNPSRSLKMFAAAVKWSLWLLLAASLLLAAAWGALHVWIVPRIGEFRPALESRAGRVLGVPVRIGAISARSEGLIPSFELQDVVLLDPQGREALRLPLVVAALSPRSLWNMGFAQLYIHAPHLDIRRAADGRVFVAGLDFSRANGKRRRRRRLVLQPGRIRPAGRHHHLDRRTARRAHAHAAAGRLRGAQQRPHPCAAAGRHAGARVGFAFQRRRPVPPAAAGGPRGPVAAVDGRGLRGLFGGRPVAAAPPHRARIRHHAGPRPPARLGRRRTGPAGGRHRGRGAGRRQRAAGPRARTARPAVRSRAGSAASGWPAASSCTRATCSSSRRTASAGRAAISKSRGRPPRASSRSAASCAPTRWTWRRSARS